MARSAVRAKLREQRQRQTKALLTKEQIKDHPRETDCFIAFSGKRGFRTNSRPLEAYVAEGKDLNLREERTLRARLRKQKELEDAAKNPVKGNPFYVRQPGQLKKAVSKATQTDLIAAAQAKRERKNSARATS